VDPEVRWSATLEEVEWRVGKIPSVSKARGHHSHPDVGTHGIKSRSLKVYHSGRTVS
jgi:hypothetical protein